MSTCISDCKQAVDMGYETKLRQASRLGISKMLSQFFVYVFSKRFRLVGRVGNAQSIADRISGSRLTTRM